MLNRFLEYREMQQLRRDHLMKQRMRYLMILMAALGSVLVVMYAVEAVRPVEPVKPAISSGPTAQQEKMQEIRDFATAITQPLDTLDKADLDLVKSKAQDPCYEKNVMLPREEMITAIARCEADK